MSLGEPLRRPSCRATGGTRPLRHRPLPCPLLGRLVWGGRGRADETEPWQSRGTEPRPEPPFPSILQGSCAGGGWRAAAPASCIPRHRGPAWGGGEGRPQPRGQPHPSPHPNSHAAPTCSGLGALDLPLAPSAPGPAELQEGLGAQPYPEGAACLRKRPGWDGGPSGRTSCNGRGRRGGAGGRPALPRGKERGARGDGSAVPPPALSAAPPGTPRISVARLSSALTGPARPLTRESAAAVVVVVVVAATAAIFAAAASRPALRSLARTRRREAGLTRGGSGGEGGQGACAAC